jgi:uncharacterized membrane protein
MWTRNEIKTRAKNVLSTSYWKALLVSIVVGIFAGSNGGGGGNLSYRISQGDFDNFWHSLSPTAINMLISFGIFAFLLIIGMRVFLGYPFEVSGKKYFTRSARGNVDMNHLGYGFTCGNYLNIVKTLLFRDIFIFLWSLLLLIPGIVKSYAYRMVPYIMADNPNMDSMRAIEISKQVTAGEKFNIFVLDLSFIGWYLLGLLAFGIGIIFVTPYERSTHAELYLIFKERAISRGICSTEELGEVAE